MASSDRILSSAVPTDLAEAVRQLAKADDRTTSGYIRHLLAAHVRERQQQGLSG
jgi:hypothetical protein